MSPDRIGAACLAAATLAVSVLVAAPTPASAAGEKVAIIVGPVGSMTNGYRSMADGVASAAQAAGATVAKAYSPNATWANVRSAVNAANVIVYFGHGNGFPNPYGSTELTDRTNGWGLNRTTTNGDGDNWSTTLAYCGEKALLGTLTGSDGAVQRTYCAGGPITPAPGFTMVYAQAHYTGGWGERYSPSDPRTTLSEAQQRVRHYSYPVLALGARGYIATAFGDADEIVTRVLTQPNRAFGAIFGDGEGYDGAALVTMGHSDIGGAQVWVQETVAGSMHFGEPDYWYGFAGNPAVTPAGGTDPGYAGPPGSRVSRHAGVDRYATAAAVSAATYSPGVGVAYVAVGTNFPDALAAGAAAANAGGPVLLVSSNRVPAPTASELARLRPVAIKVVGGPGAISDGVLEALRPYATSGAIHRVFGANRYATAAQISADEFSAGLGVAFVATGTNFPDALAGVPAAGAEDAPILLTAPAALPQETATELQRLRPGRIVVLGGPGVISDAVASQLAAYATSGVVTRIAGPDRYATAASVSATFSAAQVVFVATGRNFPDALGGGPVAGALPGPLLLVPGSSVPSSVVAELQRLDPESVVILGGTGVVTSGVASYINSILGD